MSGKTIVGKISFGGVALTILWWMCAAAAGAELAPYGAGLSGSLGEGKLSRYVPPLANPLFNESPYITTELRAIYFHQKIPNDFLTQGGDIEVVAVQARLALSDRLGIIATKDGYADINFDSVLPDEDGFANISVGLKYAVYSQVEDESIVSVGIRYEAPVGNLKTAGVWLQGNGNGFIDLFVTGATVVDKLGLQASVGVNLALDQDENTSILHYSLHADYELLPNLFPLIELNGFIPINDGSRLQGKFDGVDLVNFGSDDRGTTLTIAGGVRYRITDRIQFGTGFETPITDDEDTVMDWRIYTDLVFTF